MEIQGKIIKVLEKKNGTGSNGKGWQSQEFLIETSGEYPKQICFTVFGDKIDTMPLVIGNVVDVTFDILAKEYNGRYYNSVNAGKVFLAEGNNDNNNQSNYQQQPNNPTYSAPQQGSDDLPF